LCEEAARNFVTPAWSSIDFRFRCFAGIVGMDGARGGSAWVFLTSMLHFMVEPEERILSFPFAVMAEVGI
jgi:hypothetical protein